MTPTPRDPAGEAAADRLAFTRVRFREGYTRSEVDAFVDRAARALRSPVPDLRPEDVRAVTFTPVRVREGYEMAEVDAYLDGVEQELAARRHGLPDDGAAAPAGPKHDAVRLWVGRLRWALLVLVVVAWLYVQVFGSH